MPGWPRKEAERYIRRVARKNGIRVRWVNGPDWQGSAEAYLAARLIVIPKPYNARQFLVAMHELGHLLGAIPMSDRLKYDFDPGTWWMVMEAAAWAWAVQHIPEEITHHVEIPDFVRSVGSGMWSHAWDVAQRAENG